MTEPLLVLQDIRKNFGAIEALKGVSFSIGRGEVVALLGDNGAGKSTLVKIIAGGHEASSGHMLFEGQEYRARTPAEGKAKGIETVYQDLSLCTNVDVVSNFFMGREITRRFLGIPVLDEKAMEREVAQALANAGTRIPSLRANVEHLSGGQRQRLAIARALVTNPRILIFDEATSALDAESEEIIQHNLKAMSKGRTVLIIAHRLSAIRQCDRIITLENGCIIESGNHKQLLQAGGRYAELHKRQSGVGGVV